MNPSAPDFSPLLNVVFVGMAKVACVIIFFGIVSATIMIVMKKKGYRRDLADLTGRGVGGILALGLMWVLMVPSGTPSPLQLIQGAPVTQVQSVNTATYPNMSLVQRYLDRVKMTEDCRWHRGEFLRLAANREVGRVTYGAQQHWASVVRNNCAI